MYTILQCSICIQYPYVEVGRSFHHAQYYISTNRLRTSYQRIVLSYNTLTHTHIYIYTDDVHSSQINVVFGCSTGRGYFPIIKVILPIRFKEQNKGILSV